jgi:hypothetical protein
MHTTFRKNKKVFVIMRDGKSFIDRWQGKDGGVAIFQEHGKVKFKHIRSIGIYKIRRVFQ